MMKKRVSFLAASDFLNVFGGRMHRHGISAEKQPAGFLVSALSLKRGASPGGLCMQPWGFPFKSKRRLQIICWISNDSNISIESVDCLKALSTKMTLLHRWKRSSLWPVLCGFREGWPPKRSNFLIFLLGLSSGASSAKWSSHVRSSWKKSWWFTIIIQFLPTSKFHQVFDPDSGTLIHFAVSLPKPDRFKSAASNLARKPEQNKDQLNLVGW